MVVVATVLLTMTGCFKRDSLEDIEIVTTAYPIEFITNWLYGEHSLVTSIYPDDTNPNTYELSEKQINDYSKQELFIYNGQSAKDRDIATEFLDKNKKLLIIDSSFGMELTYGVEELWLNPSHLLMMTQNIRDGLKEYISNSYLKNEIDERYEEINVALSELDAEIKLTAENAKNKTIVVSNDTLKYLERYGFEVISLDNRNTTPSDRVIQDVIDRINNGSINYIFLFQYDEANEIVQRIIDETQVETKTFRRVDNITDEERDNSEDYLSIMNDNIDILKEELYQ